MNERSLRTYGIRLAPFALAWLGCQGGPTPGPTTEAPPRREEPPKQSEQGGGIEVLLCDGKTKTVVAPGTAGTSIAGALMDEWLRKNPNRNWEAEERERHTLQPAHDNGDLLATTHAQQQQTYGRISKQDVLIWKVEAEKLATAGSRVFHSADELGSTIAVSCDMCHPHAANTHPETYPKFQQQLGRVALLRDMINWCLEHPVRAKPMGSDDPRMRALEGYILAQRKGVALDYGKR
jgi:thiosulfate dehydrogenase